MSLKAAPNDFAPVVASVRPVVRSFEIDDERLLIETDLSDIKWFAQKSQSALNSLGSWFTDTFTTSESRAASENRSALRACGLNRRRTTASRTATDIEGSPLYKDTSHLTTEAGAGSSNATDAVNQVIRMAPKASYPYFAGTSKPLKWYLM